MLVNQQLTQSVEAPSQIGASSAPISNQGTEKTESRICGRCQESKFLLEFAPYKVSKRTGQMLYRKYCKVCWRVVKKLGEGKGLQQEPTHCNDCGDVLTDANMLSRRNSKGVARRKNRCRSCWNSYIAGWKSVQPASENRRREAKNRMLRWKFGITLADYESRKEAQGAVCMVCRQPETALDARTNRRLDLAVDHCHRTGKVRDLLCLVCNRVLGMVGEDVTRLQGLIDYLRKHS